jgi:hypothetical protein
VRKQLRAVGEIFQGGLGAVAIFTRETGGKTGMILYVLVYMMRILFAVVVVVVVVFVVIVGTL